MRFIPTGVGNTGCPHGARNPCAVHPHGCGEHCPFWGGCGYSPGSSPRVWGTPIFTPVQSVVFAVHPHGCGEHEWPEYGGHPYCGSSPRVWGTQHPLDHVHQGVRFIPTGVGNTAGYAVLGFGVPVHPHGCGEHIFSPAWRGWEVGSSPRVWGTRTIAAQFRFVERFIPTGVGNTGTALSRQTPQAVHPHGCGEHQMSSTAYETSLGSSPRVWGTQEGEKVLGYRERFIPTGVGNTALISLTVTIPSVHPHGCGEHRCVA